MIVSPRIRVNKVNETQSVNTNLGDLTPNGFSSGAVVDNAADSFLVGYFVDGWLSGSDQSDADVDALSARTKVLEALVFGVRRASSDDAADDTDHSWIPLVDGSEPPVFITDGAGSLMLVAYTP